MRLGYEHNLSVHLWANLPWPNFVIKLQNRGVTYFGQDRSTSISSEGLSHHILSHSLLYSQLPKRALSKHNQWKFRNDRPYAGLIHDRYLQFGFLEWPLTYYTSKNLLLNLTIEGKLTGRPHISCRFSPTLISQISALTLPPSKLLKMVIYSWHTYQKWWFSIVMLVYPRVLDITWSYHDRYPPSL